MSNECIHFFGPLYFTAFHYSVLSYVFTCDLILSFYFFSVIVLIHSLVNANGIPYVCAAFCDFVTQCDGPDDDHLIGRNMLSMWYLYGN